MNRNRMILAGCAAAVALSLAMVSSPARADGNAGTNWVGNTVGFPLEGLKSLGDETTKRGVPGLATGVLAGAFNIGLRLVEIPLDTGSVMINGKNFADHPVLGNDKPLVALPPDK